jgi:hypothetical protein
MTGSKGKPGAHVFVSRGCFVSFCRVGGWGRGARELFPLPLSFSFSEGLFLFLGGFCLVWDGVIWFDGVIVWFGLGICHVLP